MQPEHDAYTVPLVRDMKKNGKRQEQQQAACDMTPMRRHGRVGRRSEFDLLVRVCAVCARMYVASLFGGESRA